MELLLDYTNLRHLRKILANIPSSVTEIFASVAYNSDTKLIDTCVKRSITLEWWGLFNNEGGTSVEFIEKALANKNLISFHPVKENFHPKLIYFPSYGLYLGSANMTQKALNHNIECGVFLEQVDLESNGLLNEVEEYFYLLRSKFPVFIDEDLAKYKAYLKLRKETDDSLREAERNVAKVFSDMFSHLVDNDIAILDEKDKKETKKKIQNDFVIEWRGTLNYLRELMNTLHEKDRWPTWIDKSLPKGILTDQFLHAFYYSSVLKNQGEEKSIDLCRKMYEKAKANRAVALDTALSWWELLVAAPSQENEYSTDWYTVNAQLLSKSRILNLSVEELEMVYLRNHSARNHARQTEKVTLGLDNEAHTIEQCTVAFAKYHFDFMRLGKDIRKLFYYVIYDEKEDIAVRISNVLNKEHHLYIPHVGRSLLGEIVGWARPDECPIRNNRVNKALLCLGYDVKVFSE